MDVKVYIEPRDRWVGYYRGDRHHYVCLLPCIVIRWPRRGLGCCFRCEARALAKLPLEEEIVAPRTFAPCSCGNKRCPRSNYHRNACTGSNEPGQPGSAWEHVSPDL